MSALCLVLWWETPDCYLLMALRISLCYIYLGFVMWVVIWWLQSKKLTQLIQTENGFWFFLKTSFNVKLYFKNCKKWLVDMHCVCIKGTQCASKQWTQCSEVILKHWALKCTYNACHVNTIFMSHGLNGAGGGNDWMRL